MSALSHREFQRILIIKPSSMGDIVHALPVLHGLRCRYPSAHIAWLVSTACADLLSGHDALDEIIPFDRKRYGRLGRSASASAAFAVFVDRLRQRRFDLVIDLQGLFRSGFLALASGARTRIGPSATRELAGVFYTHRIPLGPQEEHAVDRYYRVSRPLGFDGVPVTFRLPVIESARERTRDRLRASMADSRPYAILFPSARWETKVWPAERFAGLADRLNDELGLGIVVTGAPGDAPIGEAIAHSMRHAPELVFDWSLPEMVAAIAGARLVVGNESGPIHVAAALGRPIVTIVGPTSAVRTGPYARPDAVVRRDLDCAPCYLKKITQCPHGHTCLRDLPADAVLNRCRRLLAHGSNDR